MAGKLYKTVSLYVLLPSCYPALTQFTQKDLLYLFHVETQALCSVIQPTRTGPELRHEWSLKEPNPRVVRYKVEGSNKKNEERKGVFHLVHGWIQQAQKKKVCLPLQNFSPLTNTGVRGYLCPPK